MDDATSVRDFVLEHPDWVVYYQEQTAATDQEPAKPFILAVMHPWQLQQLVKRGHEDVAAIDATHATNKYKVEFVPAGPSLSRCLC